MSGTYTVLPKAIVNLINLVTIITSTGNNGSRDSVVGIATGYGLND
jgi:hypothetical protein